MIDHRLAIVSLLILTAAALANTPPNPPVITEPATDAQIVNAADVHMETAAFSDPDPGDTHACSDWEIWTLAPSQRVWKALCVSGLEAVHIHLGDGVFENALAGALQLAYDSDYQLRVRHKDSSGQPASEWSAFATRPFHTGPATAVFPLSLDDIGAIPTPQWLDATNQPIILPPSAVASRLRVQSPVGELLLEIAAADGSMNALTNPPPLDDHADVRIRIDAGDAPGGLILAASQLQFADDHGEDHVAYLPAASIPAGQSLWLWVAQNGATFYGSAVQTSPDFSQLAAGPPVPWSVLQPGYVVEVVATGFQLPVNIAFVPDPGDAADDPFYYVAELYGTIKVVTRGGDVLDYASGLLDFEPTGTFPGSGEQGLAGIVVDPASGDVFATLLYDSPSSPGTHYPKVVRFHSLDGGLTADSQVTILDMPGESMGQSHQISNITIGPDGLLYVHTGDGFEASVAQNLGSYRGKVLRMNLDGSPASTNPFYNPANGIHAGDYVFAYGLRNPFGGTWRAADGGHYEVENGPSVDRLAKIVAGRNFGWSGGASSNAQMANFAIYNWSPSTAPVNMVFVELETFGGSGFPPEKMGHAFVTESGPTWASGPQINGKRISEFVLGNQENLISGPTPLIAYNGTGKATAVALAAGPDGLYFSDLYKDVGFSGPTDVGANILRVRYTGTADFAADYTAGPAPLCVSFTDVSNVPSPLSWLWEFGDGHTSSALHPAHAYLVPGLYTVRLTVVNAGGAVVKQKNDLIAAGFAGRVAFIGNLPLSASDAGYVSHLAASGYAVTAFDDEPANRPLADELAEEFDVAIASSTITSGNIGSEFRDVPIAFVFWEQALLTPAREPLAQSGLVLPGQTSIHVLSNTHPITAGLPAGVVAIANAATLISLGASPIGPQVEALARRIGSTTQFAVLAADAGAELLGGHVAPARRVFLPFEDATWPLLTPAGKTLFDQAIQWAVAPSVKLAGDVDADADVDLADVQSFVTVITGPSLAPLVPSCGPGDFDADGDVDLADASVIQLAFAGS